MPPVVDPRSRYFHCVVRIPCIHSTKHKHRNVTCSTEKNRKKWLATLCLEESNAFQRKTKDCEKGENIPYELRTKEHAHSRIFSSLGSFLSPDCWSRSCPTRESVLVRCHSSRAVEQRLVSSAPLSIPHLRWNAPQSPPSGQISSSSCS